jgi:Arc/MetJ family transcription regulator
VGVRLHITLEEDLVAELDRRVGPRKRSSFVAQAVRRALDDERRWELIESAIGSIPDTGHEWDEDPARWVHEQRYADAGRVG